ncbi:MAG: hypothetical protein JWN08_2662 [Frankiales bacterium]|nr:hypothetical protein [Frankiales bacterium]
MLLTTGEPVDLTAGALLRMGCPSELTTLRGPFCAARGCTSTTTVRTTSDPVGLGRQTVPRDLLPLCAHDHHARHDDHRTLEPQDGRGPARDRPV